MPSESEHRSYGNMLKNVFLLSGMWGMGLGAAFVQIPSAQNLLVENGYSSISSVPLGLIMLLSSPCAVAIPKLITRYGEKETFVAASIFGVIGSLLQMTGVLVSNDNTGSTLELALVMIGASLQSFTYASSNNLRFAVAYFSTKEFLPKATALVLFGGVFSSIFGPLLSNVTRYMFAGADYAGNFLHIAVMYCIFGVLAMLTDFESPPKQNSGEDVLEETVSMILTENGRRVIAGGASTDRQEEVTVERSLSDILKQTDLALLTFFQCLSYNIMALYMTQIQLPMIELGYGANSRTYTITAHMIGMFLPGLISGHIINWLGTWVTTFIGFAVFIVGGIFLGGISKFADGPLAIFIVGMSTIGIGWNFSFVGPSAQVSNLYNPAEKSKVVGFNDGIMLFTIGTFALAGSAIYEAIGSWYRLNVTLMGVSAFSAVIAAWRGLASRRKSNMIQSTGRDPLASSDSFFDQHLLDSL